ncbi:MAG: hypothetical protein R3C45_09715 [Phycisphaerales bacterium]
MSRQMEYDADKAFAIIAGGDAVGPTLTRLNLLGVVMQQSLQTRGEGCQARISTTTSRSTSSALHRLSAGTRCNSFPIN